MAYVNLLGRPRRRRKSRSLGSASTSCRKANGRLRKGWRLAKGGRCVRAKAR